MNQHEFNELVIAGDTCFAGQDLRSCDFTSRDLHSFDFRRANLSGCKFGNSNCRNVKFICSVLWGADFIGADISNAHFERADITNLNLIGSYWNGATIKVNPAVRDKIYWSLATDVFIQIGCARLPIARVIDMTDDERRALDPQHPDEALRWWEENNAWVKELAGR